ncbi:DUF4124 domain-containing protein [Acidithiobacillus sp. AMEEHan]|uniref:DUF4124 domain-containing protein n=1 Tax=Acidithiobacillus sp. AMEEHan TaxID=2994951 RepID=UPI0027E58610|nr:DUF4124 domain-containing protein [Acidithiobacillus sp. AMEEHan]
MQSSGRRVGVLAVVVALLSAGPALNAQATIYRWVSPDGVVSYGGNPPANARHVETLDGAPMPSAPEQAAPASGPAIDRPAQPLPKSAAAPQKNLGTQEQQALKTQLAAARLQLLQATQAYEKGKAVRYGNERNYARYLQRIDSLKEAVHVAELRVALLEHQLQQSASGGGTSSPQS